MAEKPKPGKEKGLKKEGGTAGRKATRNEGVSGRLPAIDALKQGEEKVMTIPLRNRARRSAKNKRMNRSVREIRFFLAKHMGTELSNVFISQQLNEFLWKGGFHNPPSKIRVKVSSDEDGKVLARLVDEKEMPKKERKSRLGLRERLRRKASETPSGEELARRKEGEKFEKPKEEVPETKKEEKPEPKKEGAKAPSGEKSKPEEKKEPAKPVEEEVEQDILLEQ